LLLEIRMAMGGQRFEFIERRWRRRLDNGQKMAFSLVSPEGEKTKKVVSGCKCLEGGCLAQLVLVIVGKWPWQ